MVSCHKIIWREPNMRVLLLELADSYGKEFTCIEIWVCLYQLLVICLLQFTCKIAFFRQMYMDVSRAVRRIDTRAELVHVEDFLQSSCSCSGFLSHWKGPQASQHRSMLYESDLAWHSVSTFYYQSV
jgi:hypothetical protein